MSVRVAFLGTGIIAHRHLEILSRDPDVKVVGLCDPIKEKSEAAARRFGGKGYADYRTMLEVEKPEAVYVCLPPFAHDGQEFELIQRRIAMFVEKPVALDLGYGERVAEAAEEAGIVNSVGYVWRYTDVTEVARQRLADCRVGLVRGRWLGSPRIASWWKVREKSGGQIVEQATHLFDLARYLVGEVHRVYARGCKGFAGDQAGSDIEEASVVSMEFDAGAIGEMTQTCLLDFAGSSGLELISQGQLVDLTFDTARIKTAHKEEIHANRRSPLEVENEAFIQAVKTGDRSGIKSTYADALQSLAVTLASNYSLESGDIVRL
ncbi:MAG: Gfo/Idh/MocA family oxidoreductase [Armatimonadetes bacterium]|nr:Gfo/Idh/MocA family oxidoreductase [Armatimonadota bacterium]